MIGLIWNAQGLGGQRVFRNLSRLINETNLDFCFISESKISKNAAFVLNSKLRFSNLFCVDPKGCKGGLLLLWNENLDISVLSYSSGHIDCLINCSPVPFYFTGFYDNPK